MSKIALLFAMLVSMPMITACSASEQVPETPVVKQQLLGSPVYIQIFKEERKLELYAKMGNEFRLVNTFPICNFSGGLGPKRREGDFKSPEGFYSVDARHLKPDSKYYRAINIGFPNDYDKSQGYSGAYLMIHGECKSIGCYAMTNTYMDEIYRYVEAAFAYGQSRVDISIYPFRMTEQNLKRHASSSYIAFWRQLKPGYDYFAKNHQPPMMTVDNGQYVLGQPLMSSGQMTQYASASPTPNTNPFAQNKPLTEVK
ncbi:TPA: peptidoglycan meso-diaminopimelic acid protein amidase [Serratia marcescens]|jgi:murein L,D-transpeptidase YafK|uniref:Peptidoglycan meso-diaminopimelic acid protein amidase n=1 Tax=Serratia marcescens TaxID=615 RepID=A0AAP8TSB6_SERMA|nr:MULTISPECIES: peptidoglycan meso-diaminopimelic acid protein amidase [Serratia]ASL86278.1 transpeptidase [Serratia marcescens]EIG9087089.1 murein L,D-transpeptidase [Serratia marcescens]MBH1891351.1 murein L,D-transpeptidase [Serratia marcescens]MBH2578431.1 murein L,D-transpeptidase [Serratia marcescens]MBH2684653.1 murein L,D-transpeptidase [Serratia marcescens]